MVKKVGESQTNGANDSSDTYVGQGPEYSMIFLTKDVSDLSADNVRLEKPKSKANQNG